MKLCVIVSRRVEKSEGNFRELIPKPVGWQATGKNRRAATLNLRGKRKA